MTTGDIALALIAVCVVWKLFKLLRGYDWQGGG